MNIKQSLALLSSLFFSFSAMSASKWVGDWFEVEVILISQLDDKAKLKEIFSDQNINLDYSHAVDLLTPYLNPDIALVKQQLPVCIESNDLRSYLEKATIWPSFHQNKTLATLSDEQRNEQALAEKQSSEIDDEKNEVLTHEGASIAASTHSEENEIPAQPGDNDDFFDRIKTKQEQIKTSLTQANTESDLIFNNAKKTVNEQPLLNDESVIETALTDEQKALVVEAEQAFSEIQFNYSSTFPTHYQSNVPHEQSNYINNQATSLCYITQEKFEQLNVNKSLYSYNGFLVNKMPTTVNGIEKLYNEAPYLTNEDSLQLKDIVKQLRRSKNFRPLLHLAWRQPVFEKNNSTPIRIFAGDNIQGQYAKNLANYQTEKNAVLLEEQALNTIITLSENINVEEADLVDLTNTKNLSPDTVLTQIKTESVNTILQEISAINDINEIIPSLSDDAPQRLDIIHSNSMFTSAPEAPVQPWYIEGLMEVYLIGNYLHLANDFSILNMTLAEQESLKLKTSMLENLETISEPASNQKVIPIRMTQDRRMISREVHYFDHPYLGIIVQIRRHQRPELPSELPSEISSENAND